MIEPIKLPPPFPANISLISSGRQALPTAYHDQYNNLVHLGSDPAAFVHRDLDVSRLNKVHRYLWLAGRPTSARPLHRQKMIERQILISEQADLHLVWHESRIFLKPLPDYILDHQFWNDIICNDAALYANSCGFLLSYVWLLCHPSDLKIALELGLISSQINWNDWNAFVDIILANIDYKALDLVNERYQYGELRLSRLNAIHRLTYILEPQHFFRGFLYGYNRYTVFFARNFGWVLFAFLYISIVLNAMQVGIGTTELQDNEAFHRASYGFVVFSIVLPIFTISIGLLLFSLFFVFNLLTTRAFLKSQKQRRQEAIQ